MIRIFSANLTADFKSLQQLDNLPEPTRSILQNAYDLGDYEILPDPELVEQEEAPNWQAWQAEILSNPHIIGAFEQLPIVVVASLITLIGQVADKPETIAGISVLWGQISPAIPQLLRNTVKESAQRNNLPAEFVAII